MIKLSERIKALSHPDLCTDERYIEAVDIAEILLPGSESVSGRKRDHDDDVDGRLWFDSCSEVVKDAYVRSLVEMIQYILCESKLKDEAIGDVRLWTLLTRLLKSESLASSIINTKLLLRLNKVLCMADIKGIGRLSGEILALLEVISGAFGLEMFTSFENWLSVIQTCTELVRRDETLEENVGKLLVFVAERCEDQFAKKESIKPEFGLLLKNYFKFELPFLFTNNGAKGDADAVKSQEWIRKPILKLLESIFFHPSLAPGYVLLASNSFLEQISKPEAEGKVDSGGKNGSKELKEGGKSIRKEPFTEDFKHLENFLDTLRKTLDKEEIPNGSEDNSVNGRQSFIRSLPWMLKSCIESLKKWEAMNGSMDSVDSKSNLPGNDFLIWSLFVSLVLPYVEGLNRFSGRENEVGEKGKKRRKKFGQRCADWAVFVWACGDLLLILKESGAYKPTEDKSGNQKQVLERITKGVPVEEMFTLPKKKRKKSTEKSGVSDFEGTASCLIALKVVEGLLGVEQGVLHPYLDRIWALIWNCGGVEAAEKVPVLLVKGYSEVRQFDVFVQSVLESVLVHKPENCDILLQQDNSFVSELSQAVLELPPWQRPALVKLAGDYIGKLDAKLPKSSLLLACEMLNVIVMGVKVELSVAESIAESIAATLSGPGGVKFKETISGRKEIQEEVDRLMAVVMLKLYSSLVFMHGICASLNPVVDPLQGHSVSKAQAFGYFAPLGVEFDTLSIRECVEKLPNSPISSLVFVECVLGRMRLVHRCFLRSQVLKIGSSMEENNGKEEGGGSEGFAEGSDVMDHKHELVDLTDLLLRTIFCYENWECLGVRDFTETRGFFGQSEDHAQCRMWSILCGSFSVWQPFAKSLQLGKFTRLLLGIAADSETSAMQKMCFEVLSNYQALCVPGLDSVMMDAVIGLIGSRIENLVPKHEVNGKKVLNKKKKRKRAVSGQYIKALLEGGLTECDVADVLKLGIGKLEERMNGISEKKEHADPPDLDQIRNVLCLISKFPPGYFLSHIDKAINVSVTVGMLLTEMCVKMNSGDFADCCISLFKYTAYILAWDDADKCKTDVGSNGLQLLISLSECALKLHTGTPRVPQTCTTILDHLVGIVQSYMLTQWYANNELCGDLMGMINATLSGGYSGRDGGHCVGLSVISGFFRGLGGLFFRRPKRPACMCGGRGVSYPLGKMDRTKLRALIRPLENSLTMHVEKWLDWQEQVDASDMQVGVDIISLGYLCTSLGTCIKIFLQPLPEESPALPACLKTLPNTFGRLLSTPLFHQPVSEATHHTMLSFIDLLDSMCVAVCQIEPEVGADTWKVLSNVHVMLLGMLGTPESLDEAQPSVVMDNECTIQVVPGVYGDLRHAVVRSLQSFFDACMELHDQGGILTDMAKVQLKATQDLVSSYAVLQPLLVGIKYRKLEKPVANMLLGEIVDFLHGLVINGSDQSDWEQCGPIVLCAGMRCLHQLISCDRYPFDGCLISQCLFLCVNISKYGPRGHPMTPVYIDCCSLIYGILRFQQKSASDNGHVILKAFRGIVGFVRRAGRSSRVGKCVVGLGKICEGVSDEKKMHGYVVEFLTECVMAMTVMNVNSGERFEGLKGGACMLFKVLKEKQLRSLHARLQSDEQRQTLSAIRESIGKFKGHRW